MTRRLALFARAVIDAYLGIYHSGADSGTDSGMPPYDTASTISGQFDRADGTHNGVVGFGVPPSRRALRLRGIDMGEPDE